MEIIDTITNFFDSPFFIITGGLTATLAVIGILGKMIFFMLGITPIMWRLAQGTMHGKIHIVADLAKFDEYKSKISDVKFINPSNLIHVRLNEINKVKDARFCVFDWDSASQHWDQVFSNMQPGVPIIIKSQPGGINEEKFKKINDISSVSVANMWNRFLSDLLMSFLTHNPK